MEIKTDRKVFLRSIFIATLGFITLYFVRKSMQNNQCTAAVSKCAACPSKIGCKAAIE